jgi:DNA-binding XRE family transcriptional regulator
VKSARTLPPILTRNAMACVLGISPDTLLRWEGERRIPFCRLTQKVTVYVLEDVVQFVRTKTVPALGAMPLPPLPRAQGPGKGVCPVPSPTRGKA